MRVAKGCGGQHGDEKKEEGVALVVPPPYGGRQRPSLFTALVYGALCMLVSKEPMLRRNFRDRPMSQLGQGLSSASSLRRPESRSGAVLRIQPSPSRISVCNTLIFCRRTEERAITLCARSGHDVTDKRDPAPAR